VITGEPALGAPSTDDFTWYERFTGGIRIADGKGVAAEHCRHPDPVAEALRWQACEANLIQAIGRLRALRRKAERPFFLDIVSDVPLPITVDVVTPWERARPGRWADMAGDGVLLSSPADVQAAFPDLAPTREAARWVVEGLTLGVTSIRELSIDVTPDVAAVTYKRRGRFMPAGAFLLPNAPGDLRHWLGERLGPIEWVRTAEARPASSPGGEHAREEPPRSGAREPNDVREPNRSAASGTSSG